MAAAQIANWIKQNPFPINMQSGPQAPQQTNQQFGGGQYGGTHGQIINGSPPLTGPPPFIRPIPRAPQPVATAQPQGAPPAPPQPNQPMGLGMMTQHGGNALGGNQQLIQALRNAGLA